VNAVETDLRRALEASEPRLQLVSEEEASRSPAPGKWSAKQVIGHLIDSASNNHQRFVRAQFTDDLVFPGYEQEAWVSVQRYQEASWTDLVGLWHLFNLHLARVIEAIPRSVREKRRARHNLHELAWRPVPESEAATLEYFMRDYVEHLNHHLAQVLGR
jgi:DinB family protein